MTLPFTVDQFLAVFRDYNLAVWPMQVVAYIIGVLMLYWAIKKTRYSDRLICASLSFFWIWIGIVYHLMNFTSINKAAYIFGVLFIIQGIIFLGFGVISDKITFKFNSGIYSVTGSMFIIYAMIIYPIIGYFAGHVYPQYPSFGITPCPAAIFTFGLLLWTDKKLPLKVLLIPFIWSVIGFGATFSLGIREDMGLLVAGVIGIVLIALKNRKRPSVTAEMPRIL